MKSHLQCMTCRAGQMHEQRTSYMHWKFHQPIFLLGVVIWSCDVCGEVAFDASSIEQLEMLLDGAPKPNNLYTNKAETKTDNYAYFSSKTRRMWRA